MKDKRLRSQQAVVGRRIHTRRSEGRDLVLVFGFVLGRPTFDLGLGGSGLGHDLGLDEPGLQYNTDLIPDVSTKEVNFC